jgi:hypothetical protein
MDLVEELEYVGLVKTIGAFIIAVNANKIQPK